MKHIVFLSGWAVPTFISKSKYVWNEPFWEDYHCTFIPSKTPISDQMIEMEMGRLQKIIDSFPDPIVVGHSLGGWWASNLAVRDLQTEKLVLWTPLSNTSGYPVFNASEHYQPINHEPKIHGPSRVLTFVASYDMVTPPYQAKNLCKFFNATPYFLSGGHYFQSDHQAGLQYTKDWIELV